MQIKECKTNCLFYEMGEYCASPIADRDDVIGTEMFCSQYIPINEFKKEIPHIKYIIALDESDKGQLLEKIPELKGKVITLKEKKKLKIRLKDKGVFPMYEGNEFYGL
jgi:hypothetical protein